jgi:hypothetical protein
MWLSLPRSSLLLLLISVLAGLMMERPPSLLLSPSMGVVHLGLEWTCLCGVSSVLLVCLALLLLVLLMQMRANCFSMQLSPHCWTLQSSLILNSILLRCLFLFLM